MFAIIQERQAMTKHPEAYGFRGNKGATPASFKRVFSSHMCMTIYTYTHTCTHAGTLIKHSRRKACHVSMR